MTTEVLASSNSVKKWRRRHLLAATILASQSLSAWDASPPPIRYAHAFSSPAILGATRNSVSVSGYNHNNPIFTKLYSETTSTQSDNDTSSSSLPSPNDMRLREIQTELKEMNISYADCFDRESLVKRLVEARDGLIAPTIPPATEATTESSSNASEEPSQPASADTTTTEEPNKNTKEAESTTTSTTSSESEESFDRESTLTELRTLRVKELKEKLSALKVRWGTMIEKEEMVQALCNAMEERFEQSKNFSRSGELVPGTVVDAEEATLIRELGWLESDVSRGVATSASSGAEGGGSPHPPILLDVYATWCGPCQFLAPLLVEAAEELGPTVRVIKLDSDKHPRIASVLKVGGLPTLIRFDGGDVSKELQRVEGALTKDQIIDFVNGNFNR
eukprot:CAMPEP_0183712478 /NCGR_PEP_ID=MMETSP0737-20130205/7594_1 /TAXON_ID=385413 /ORGANISM="Thalassiosira miniscula, Strain CCMP1093" /LENGTH=391 /DNA_ID=CAMNT_0025941095 /DNA_START=79 /DNA_END=1254 /DNA_ORIENTATION=-